MGFQSLQFKLPTDFNSEQLEKLIYRKTKLKSFTWQIEKKSLDARKKNDIHWLINVVVKSDGIKHSNYKAPAPLEFNYKKRAEKIIVIGSGPAGIFAARVLQLSGFKVSIFERGHDVETRTEALKNLHKNSIFDASDNYAFGEGGAGTFSDGKLTSRSKHISAERRFILQEYVNAGAPEEILYMSHPHIGTDNLKIVARNMRKKFIEEGGEFLFGTMLEDIKISKGKVSKIISNTGTHGADYLVLATGHSAYETYRMLLNRGIKFRTKNFAIGHRIEHPQRIINIAQWGVEKLAGVKAAEYRLTSKASNGLPVYSFCMCPGGQVVPAAAYDKKSVVNGMSYFSRNGYFANAGCVAGVHPDMLVGHTATTFEALDFMDKLEESFYEFKNSFTIPANGVKEYMQNKIFKGDIKSSYPLGLENYALRKMVPSFVADAISDGLKDFSRRLNGFDKGVLMGLESKTSSPLQAIREKDGQSEGVKNLFIVGEGSGYSGGIISSAADGVKCAMALASR